MPEEKSPIYEFHDDCEKKVYINWINRNLFSKNDMGTHLPINPNSEDLFDQVNDGIIFCLTVKDIFPNSMDITVMYQADEMAKEEKLKNLQLAYETARSYGCNILELKLNHIFTGVRQSVLEFFWQIFLVGLVKSINYLENPEIIVLKRHDETNDVIKNMKPEEILIRYVNYVMHAYNPSAPQVKDFQRDFTDGKVYALLIDSISQHFKINLSHPLSECLQECNIKDRYDLLMDNLDYLKVIGFLVENLMEMNCKDQACYKMNLLTVAVIFHKYPLTSFSTPESMQYLKENMKFDQENNLEKLCKVFINFIGMEPVCTNLIYDCKDGLLIAQIMDLLIVDIFKREVFITNFTERQLPSERIHNGAICVNKLNKFVSCPIDPLCAEYIQSGNRKMISDIMFNLMLYWTYCDNEETQLYNKKELLDWINSLSDEFKINSFRDTQINDKKVFAKAVGEVFPGSVDWCYLDKLATNKDRALYCISVARRQGCPMFINPNMMAIGDHRCVTLAFALLRCKSPKSDKKCPPD